MSSLIGKLIDRATGEKSVSPVAYSSIRGTSLSAGSGGADPAAYMRAYGSSGTVYSIVSMLARQTAKVKWSLYRQEPQDGRRRYTTGDRGSDERVEVIKHQAIALWHKPNPFMSEFQVKELVQTYLDLTGEGPMVMQKAGGASFPTGIWPVRPDRIEPVPSREKFLNGYVYQGPNGEVVPLQPDEVVMLKYPNPFDMYHGLGPIQSILIDIDAAKYSAQWNRNFFLNSATPGGVIQVDKRLSDEEWNELTNRWRETHRGVGAAHRVAILEAGATWVPNAHTIRDMDFATLRNVSRDVIREAFSIHKSILGTVEDVNRANAQTAQEHFEAFLIADRLDRWRDTLNSFYLPLFGATGQGVEMDHADPVSANREADALELQAKAQAAYNLISAGYDPDDVTDTVGLPKMDTVERATQAPALPPRWVPAEDGEQPAEEQPAPAEKAGGKPAAPAAQERFFPRNADDPAARVFEQVAANYPPEATAWMHHATWKGPVTVPLGHIDPTPEWLDTSIDPGHVQKLIAKVRKGKKLKPVVLVKTPDGTHLQLVDGHHRYLAAFELGQALPAYIGTVDEDHGPWETMHRQQLASGSEAANAATLSKGQVHYRDAGGAQRRCGTCTMFRPPHGCTLVRGSVDAGGVCDRWAAKNGPDSGAEAMLRRILSNGHVPIETAGRQ